jgi:hypothetical protein
MSGNGNGAGRIHLLNDHRSPQAKTDDQGRVLKHNASIQDAHQIAIEEGNKVHEFYLNQIPPFVARMIQDALVSYGLIKLSEEATLAATPAVETAPEALGTEGTGAVAAGDVATS